MRVLLLGGETSERNLLADGLCRHTIAADAVVDAHAACAIARYAPPDIVVYLQDAFVSSRRLRDVLATVEAVRGEAPSLIAIGHRARVQIEGAILLRAPARLCELLAAVRALTPNVTHDALTRVS